MKQIHSYVFALVPFAIDFAIIMVALKYAPNRILQGSASVLAPLLGLAVVRVAIFVIQALNGWNSAKASKTRRHAGIEVALLAIYLLAAISFCAFYIATGSDIGQTVIR